VAGHGWLWLAPPGERFPSAGVHPWHLTATESGPTISRVLKSALQPDQERLFIEMVEAEHGVPRHEQRWRLFEDVLYGPWGERPVLSDDVHVLDEAGFLKGTSCNYLYGNNYVISPAGHKFYAAVKKQRTGEPMERAEDEVRRFIDADAFREAYPAAYERWAEAEALLWAANSEREFTTVGHKARQAMQAFATEVVERYGPMDVGSRP
jgi:hypothetical protein